MGLLIGQASLITESLTLGLQNVVLKYLATEMEHCEKLPLELQGSKYFCLLSLIVRKPAELEVVTIWVSYKRLFHLKYKYFYGTQVQSLIVNPCQ